MATTEPKTDTGLSVALSHATEPEQWLAKQAGVEVKATPMGLAWRIGRPKDLAKRVHPLLPASQVVQVDANFRPLFQMVQLDEEEHTYPEHNATSIKTSGGQWLTPRALNARGLAQIAQYSGVQWLDPKIEHILAGDKLLGVTVHARGIRREQDGTMARLGASKTIRFEEFRRKARRERLAGIKKASNANGDWGRKHKAILEDPEALEEELQKFIDDRMEHIDQAAHTKAKNAAVRPLGVKATYAPGEINAKPFLCLRWVITPDRNDPLVRDLIAATFGSADSALYGSGDNHSIPSIRPMTAIAAPDDHEEDTERIVPQEDDIVEHGDVVEIVPPSTDSDGDDGPPIDKPNQVFPFTSGPHAGASIEDVVRDQLGRRYVAEVAAKLTEGTCRSVLLAWLSYAWQREVKPEDCAELSKAQPEDDIPF